ncbi:CAP domain-containing protein [Micromonospora sp. NPDC049240]|uniref:CAP domain-containing protein n=1 Tax=Micromonospora sp. NPDC049240 TaxID=3155151 RepID=UPI0033EABEE3
MYRWTDPIDPDDAARRPEPPTDQGPAWLTDRPEPRSSYLFGDESGQPPAGHLPPTLDAGRYGDTTRPGHGPADATEAHPGWGHPAEPGYGSPAGYGHGDQPGYGPAAAPGYDRTAGYDQAGYDQSRYDQPGYDQPGYDQPGYDQPGYDQPGYGPAAVPGHDRPGHAQAQPAYDPRAPYAPGDSYPAGRDRWNGEEPAGGWEQPTAAWQPVTDTPADDDRHRPKRRLSRPFVIGGAAAAATLVVSLGVGAVLLPGDDGPAERAAVDAPVAAAPSPTGASDATPAAGASASGSASASPSTAPTTAKPSPTRKVAPKPSRTTAPSRQQQRSSAPSGTTARTTSSGGLSAELQQVVDLVNQERAKAGCKALGVDSKLTLAAQRHSQDQADHKTMTHDGSDGSDVGQRLDRVGYAWRAAAENVAWGQQGPAEVMDAWMNSPGHRKNILNCSYTEIGVGVARSNGPYWTQDFGTPR